VRASTSLLFFLLALAVSPALADSINTVPPPITSFALTGLGCDFGVGGFICFKTNANLTETVISNSSVSVPLGGYNELGGDVTSFTITSNNLSGTFSGEEDLVGSNSAVYGYDVSGTFSIQDLNGGANMQSAQITITSYTFEGRVGTTPEPGTWVLFGTGLCGIIGATRRKLLPSR
jgi:hypothetical protein